MQPGCGAQSLTVTWVEPGPEVGIRQLHVLPQPLVVSGLEVFWNASAVALD
jgi:hypothetical protein